MGVYLTFRYLLPLVIPFLIAYLGAELMAPMVRFLQKKLRMKRSFAAVAVVLIYFVFLTTVGIWIVNKLAAEVSRLIQNLGDVEIFLQDKLKQFCYAAEENFGLKHDTIYFAAASGVSRITTKVEEEAMPLVMSNSLPVVKTLFEWITVVFITLVSMLIMCKDYEALKEKQSRMLYAEEADKIMRKISGAMSAYVKTQGVLMLITMGICVAGLFLLKNPYALLLGITIGFLDALPFVGTGIIFIPWALLTGIMGEWKRCVGLLLIYGLCYLVRELLEPRLMGKQIGMTSLEMMISMYVGIRLFGLAGVILGPMGYLLIVELFHSFCGQQTI